MAQKEKICRGCGRIYEPVDWDGTDCPFCGVALEELSSHSRTISDMVSTELEWPAGQKRKMIARVGGYMNAQLIKAQLESNGIPVYLDREATMVMGAMQEVRIFVPENMAAKAATITGNV